MVPYIQNGVLVMHTTHAVELIFPEMDSKIAISQATFSEAAHRLDLTENELIQRALAYYVEVNRDENGVIKNIREYHEHLVATDCPGRFDEITRLANSFSGEQSCRESIQDGLSAAGSRKGD